MRGKRKATIASVLALGFVLAYVLLAPPLILWDMKRIYTSSGKFIDPKLDPSLGGRVRWAFYYPAYELSDNVEPYLTYCQFWARQINR